MSLLNKSFIVVTMSAFALIMTQFGCGPSINDTVINNGKISGDFTGCYIGAFVNGVANLSDYSAMTGTLPVCVLSYLDFTQEFPLSDANQINNAGAIPFITWEPWKADTRENLFPLKTIVEGSFDAYIIAWAKSAKSFKYPLFMRFAHEMNGNWYPWSGFQNGGSTGEALYIDAWKHVYNIFKSEGASNVTWVWNVNANSVPSEGWNTPDKYYPGDSYVDWIAIDGFNFGASSPSTFWQSFDSIFLSMYTTLNNLYPSKPLMIGEMACSEVGGSKPDWIVDAFSKIKTNYKNIKLCNWFNVNKETDWRLDSSTDSLSAFKNAISDKIYFIEKR